MLVHYISPSVIPSRSANAVHVAKQCDALARQCAEVRCYARRSTAGAGAAEQRIRDDYGLTSPNLVWKTHFLPFNRAITFCIALHALLKILPSPNRFVLSRNLYASYVWGVLLSRKLLFETHQLETGLGRWMQRQLIKKSNITTVVISGKLKEILEEYHNAKISNCLVLHDAATFDTQRFSEHMRAEILKHSCGIERSAWRSVCGYFGHLYPGRGIEIIVAMAQKSPDDLFIVVGGTEGDIERLRSEHQGRRNLHFLGFKPHSTAQRIMKSVDVLLMPYQKIVSIGVQGHDTARWMSPMKMFEYMACAVPIISSDLEVLREVLQDSVNALLVKPDDACEWSAALERLHADKALAAKIAEQACRDYRTHYTWDKRAERIIAEFR